MSRECSRTSRRCTTAEYLLFLVLFGNFPEQLCAAIAEEHQAAAAVDNNWPPYATTDTDVSELCSTLSECSVVAEFNRIDQPKYLGIIKCTERPSDRNIAVGPYINIPQISLNGCGVNRSDTLGVEFVPDPQAVRRLQVRMFRVSAPIGGGTFGAYVGLTDLVLADNILGGLQADSLQEMLELRTLVISNNTLRAIGDGALVGLTKLENLTIYEPHMELAAGPQLPDALRVWRLQALGFSWPDDNKWPSLEQLSIHHTPVTFSSVEHFVSSLQQSLRYLHTLELVACNLTAWPTFHHTALRTLNISHNRVQYLSEFRLPQLIRLDLSFNWLLDLPDNVLQPAAGLHYLNVQHNRLERLANNAFSGCAQLGTVWLAGNRLRQISPNLSEHQHTLFHIDENSWNCRWVQEISNSNPLIFAQFRYAKHLNVVSMNGLPCRFYDSYEETTLIPADTKSVVSDHTEESYRWLPKDPALLTLIILMMGVAFLCLLLYLLIRCRRAVMEPFYRTLPYEQQQHQQQHPQNQSRRLLKGSQQQPLRLTERTEFVRRQLPATDYEVPIRCPAGTANGGGAGRLRMRTPQNSCERTADGEPSADTVEAEGIRLGDRIYEEINECKRPTVLSRCEPPAEAGDAVAKELPKLTYASMNNMLFGQHVEDDSH